MRKDTNILLRERKRPGNFQIIKCFVSVWHYFCKVSESFYG